MSPRRDMSLSLVAMAWKQFREEFLKEFYVLMYQDKEVTIHELERQLQCLQLQVQEKQLEFDTVTQALQSKVEDVQKHALKTRTFGALRAVERSSARRIQTWWRGKVHCSSEVPQGASISEVPSEDKPSAVDATPSDESAAGKTIEQDDWRRCESSSLLPQVDAMADEVPAVPVVPVPEISMPEAPVAKPDAEVEAVFPVEMQLDGRGDWIIEEEYNFDARGQGSENSVSGIRLGTQTRGVAAGPVAADFASPKAKKVFPWPCPYGAGC